ncbi:6-pyruvoyl-tetrahydropterin synthase-related protein [Patescibacteria group bacterium]|nr:6-pyruvoyl-tetrahydropterin synthase-related protein [Patescibacteria group bacterium]
MGKEKLSLFIIFIFAFLAVFPLLHPGLIPTHDGEYHVVRFYEFNKTLTDGNWYPRWASDLNFGFGIPLFNYVYPLPNYVSSFFHIFGISFIDAFKLNLFAALLLAVLFFYLWTRSFFEEKGAIVGAIFYLFSPYMFVDTYIRGSVGEVWAIALFPAFLWAITEFIYKDKKVFFPVSVIFLALIIFSHNILALMFFPFAVLYSLFIIFLSKKRKTLIIKLLALITLGLGLSSIFWLPALSETKYTVGLQIFDYKNNFPNFYQLLFPSWGSGFFGGNLASEMSVQIGVANLLTLLISIIAFVKLMRKKDYRGKLMGFFIISFFAVTFLMLRISLPIWEKIPLMNYFQFPWRFLSLTILICSFLAAGIFSVVKQKAFFIAMLFLPVVLAFNYARPAYYIDRTDSYYITRPNFIDGTNSIGNSFNTIWFKAKPVRKNEKIELLGKGKINIKELKSNSYKFDAMLSESSKAVVNTAYFPGWTAYVDGRPQGVKIEDNGTFSYLLPAGNHSSTIVLEDTLIRRVSMYLSAISLLIVLLNILMSVKIKR